MTNEADRQRRERLRAALRENLKRRKAQVRTREAQSDAEKPDFAKTGDPGKEPGN